ncbi:hypothetical protein WJX74_004772 [Apatococcus lobatus]|uniref:BHLH domain-containing protein n=1 Tax=Apatococcus lobatus TaxID=904363 RepID=A0AAW1QM95_9CHLO
MQPNRPLRPLALIPNLRDLMDAASAAGRVNGQQSNGLQPGVGQQVGLSHGLAGNLSGLRSAFHAVPPGPQPQALYPEIALFSQLGQLFPQAQELQLQQHQQHAGVMAQQQPAESGRTNGRAKSSDSKASSAYASRHQAAEQRRRTRINERLDRLRSVVPHAERANTASFLEEVIKYIQDLQKRIQELEASGAQSSNTALGKLDALTASQTGFPQQHQDDMQPHTAHPVGPGPAQPSSNFEPNFDAMRHTPTGLPQALSDPAEGPPSPGRSAVNASYDGISTKKRKLDDAT